MAKRKRRGDVVKTIDDLRVEDFQAFPVWEFTNCHEETLDETAVRPVERLPATDLDGKIVGTEVALANGRRVWALIANVDVADPRMTEHFLDISLEHDGRWFPVANNAAFDFAERGPDRAAEFMGLHVDDVFPISYDLREIATGDVRSLQGEIPKEPRERLTLEERFALIFPEPDGG
ncbi:hypothetical protein [Methylopila sp. M107]|uniref:hypothetical protein n=1 Tax=Methylopila sp. M107 TaxID=1101190 RepID=UPI000374EB1F|nr:hypothetical protein [Methylopila sp. M107]